MRTKQIFQSELKITFNIKTDKAYYYLLKCGVWVRISKAEYLAREEESFRADCMQTWTKGNMIYNTKIIYIEVWTGKDDNDHKKQMNLF